MERDLRSIITPVVAVDLTSKTGANTTTVGNIIDTEGFEGIDFIIRADNLLSGLITPLLEDGDNSALSDAAAVDDAYIIGTDGVETGQEAEAALAADGVSHIGYVGKKRYVRLSLVSTGGPTGDISATAVKGFPRNAPTA